MHEIYKLCDRYTGEYRYFQTYEQVERYCKYNGIYLNGNTDRYFLSNVYGNNKPKTEFQIKREEREETLKDLLNDKK